ncbi:uncharacterized protein LOC126894865 [Daktulosphaira vitifoliae]|uniref:uncharacterized protein LOC126894865 n=1 Tax=Daktulosphaira vitifoliae TaxID=58002 RepID=UPI0021AA708C|nr:uncharacterized protein LOC126894865 [Daktulosphaira vitifoliae]
MNKVFDNNNNSDSDDGDFHSSSIAINYKTRKRLSTTAVYTITNNEAGHEGGTCTCCRHDIVQRLPHFVNNEVKQQKPRPHTWTFGSSKNRTFSSSYERAISSLLWQPYECQSSTNFFNDDGDVTIWLNSSRRNGPLSRRSSLSLSTVQRSEDLCSSSVCYLLEGIEDGTISCWCSMDDPDSILSVDSTGCGLPPLGSLLPRLHRRKQDSIAAAHSQSIQTLLLSDRRSSLVSVPSRTAIGPGSVGVGVSVCDSDRWCCDNVENEDYYENVNRKNVGRVRIVMNNSSDSNTMHGGVSTLDTTPNHSLVSDIKPSTHAAERTYASTEAQTDETACSSVYREQRRRERRERRQQQRRVHLPVPAQSFTHGTMIVPVDHSDRLPDLLLNSHLPPPLYTTVGGGCEITARTNLQAALLPTFQHPNHLPNVAAVPTISNSTGGFRLPFGFIPSRRRRSLHYCSEEDTPKTCCGLLTLPDATSTVSIRWFIGIVFVAGICSALVGTVLGATRASGKEHLTVALLMIGVGVILVAISGIAWRLTAGQEASSCSAVFGLGRTLDDTVEANRRFVPRLPPSYGRPHHPYAAMMYPEFEYRAPPPSYQASMQEYRLRLLLLDRQTSRPPVTASPPPTYRSQPNTLIRGQNPCCRNPTDLYLYQPSALLTSADFSGPPSYRSRTSTMRPGCHLMDPVGSTIGSHNHSRNSSQLSAMSEAVGGGGCVSLDTVDKFHMVEDIVVVDEKHDLSSPLTIVQTTTSQIDQLSSNNGPVIVTVSGATNDTAANGRHRENEMEILAHL